MSLPLDRLCRPDRPEMTADQERRRLRARLTRQTVAWNAWQEHVLRCDLCANAWWTRSPRWCRKGAALNRRSLREDSLFVAYQLRREEATQ